jgi:diacylglycerol kinase (ATP)
MMPQKPTRTTGLPHLIAATGYSLAGLQRLWREAAFRHEVLAGGAGLLILLASGASFSSLAIFGMLLLALLAVEALNTAIEMIVDHLSPEWSEFGKHAKDIGSAAVLLMIIVNAIWFLMALSDVWVASPS